MSLGSRDPGSDRERRFRRLFSEHYRDVLGYAMRRASRADAEDVAAMVFLTAWRRFDELPKDADAVPWLYGVARRVLANQQRGQRRRQRLLTRLRSEQPAPTVASNSKVDGRASVVLEALSHLKSADQEVLRLAAWEGLSHTEIGQVLGFSQGAVAVRLHRARRRLERRLRSAGFPRLGPVDPLQERSGV